MGRCDHCHDKRNNSAYSILITRNFVVQRQEIIKELWKTNNWRLTLQSIRVWRQRGGQMWEEMTDQVDWSQLHPHVLREAATPRRPAAVTPQRRRKWGLQEVRMVGQNTWRPSSVIPGTIVISGCLWQYIAMSTNQVRWMFLPKYAIQPRNILWVSFVLKVMFALATPYAI